MLKRPDKAGLGTVKEATSLKQNRELEKELWDKSDPDDDSENDDDKVGLSWSTISLISSLTRFSLALCSLALFSLALFSLTISSLF